MRALATTTLLVLAACPAPVDSGGRALSLSWLGAGGTQIRFDSFVETDHTVMVRFAPQYPHAAVQAVLGENGGGTFLVGIVRQEAPAGVRLVVNVGSQFALYDVGNIEADQWVSAALVGRHDDLDLTYDVWFEGERLDPPITLSVNDSEFPSGTLLLGQRTALAPGPVRQFYGLIDDLAVYDTALDDEDVVEQMNPATVLTGRTSDLLATLTFEDDDGLPESPLLPSGPTSVVDVGARSSGVDTSVYATPANTIDLVLPFEPGVAWRVVRGGADPSTRHTGTKAFSLDFEVDGQPPSGEYPAGTSGAPVLAPFEGSVIVADDLRPSSATIPNVIEVRHADGEYARYEHIAQGRSQVGPTASVSQDDVIGFAGDVGAPSHTISFEMATHPAGIEDSVTFPVPFTNYERQTASGDWEPVERGVPAVGDVIRRP